MSAEIVSTVGELASELAVNLSRGIENRNNEGDEVEAAAPATSNKHSQVLKTAKDVAAAALVAAGLKLKYIHVMNKISRSAALLLAPSNRYKLVFLPLPPFLAYLQDQLR